MLTTDNGLVLKDGYYDDAVEKQGKHTPAGPLRGGKYSLFEAGTRVPFMTYSKGRIEPMVSDALVCQIDLLTSLASLVESDIQGKDSQDILDAFLGKVNVGRKELVIETTTRIALRKGDWFMIPPYKGRAVNKFMNIELGNSNIYQLYKLKRYWPERLEPCTTTSLAIHPLACTVSSKNCQPSLLLVKKV